MALSRELSASGIVRQNTWKLIAGSPTKHKSMSIQVLFANESDFIAIFDRAKIKFPPDLLSALQDPSPPTIQWFTQAPGYPPVIYIGSGTAVRAGCTDRITQHNHYEKLPDKARRAYDDGYRKTHTGLLCWLPVPSATDVAQIRLLTLALEAFFTFYFGTIKRYAAFAYGSELICPWADDDFEYGGLCSHTPLMESADVDPSLTIDQLELKADLSMKRRCATFKRSREKRKAEDPKTWKATQSARQAKVRAEHVSAKRFHCDPCGRTLGAKAELSTHCRTTVHKANVRAKASSLLFQCKPCGLHFFSQENLDRHLSLNKH